MNITTTARVTANAVTRTTKTDKKVVNFNVAVNDPYKVKATGEVKQNTQFIRCAYWITDKVAPYLTKGTVVELTGAIGTEAYTNKQGDPQAALTLNVRNIKFHSAKPAIAAPAEGVDVPADDDLPF
ncbi:single-stranded DNA-binding protein [Mucilaginibacter defluvii]|uniref:Single-stranded DNA-binding protein n=1 Tax=Mucilaginibacter defluvii TaxID=1196019 RepID=A0ABP9FLG2_9SPHI